jgi:hypothetical protein
VPDLRDHDAVGTVLQHQDRRTRSARQRPPVERAQPPERCFVAVDPVRRQADRGGLQAVAGRAQAFFHARQALRALLLHRLGNAAQRPQPRARERRIAQRQFGLRTGVDHIGDGVAGVALNGAGQRRAEGRRGAAAEQPGAWAVAHHGQCCGWGRRVG